MIILVRHGQTVWNLENRKQGRKDSPLTLKGINQGLAIGNKLKDENVQPDNVFVSPLMRAKQAASIVLESMGVLYTNVIFDDRIQEHSFGLWEGMTQPEVDEKYGEFVTARKSNWWDFIIPMGESYELLQMRVDEFLKELDMDKVNLVICHEMVSKVMRGLYGNLDKQDTLLLGHPQDSYYILDNQKIKIVTAV